MYQNFFLERAAYMFGGVKITLIISLTVLTSCILLISYSEYANRYNIIGNSDNSIYIFDKKSIVLNRCSENGCKVIETKLPVNGPFGLVQMFSQSKMFEADKPMTKEVASAKIEAVEATATAAPIAPVDTQEKKEEPVIGEVTPPAGSESTTLETPSPENITTPPVIPPEPSMAPVEPTAIEPAPEEKKENSEFVE
ncbi:MAG: hypothetical protein LBT03_00355 [Holosporales bacterium]|jgi:hypothetical protein|nr:hypothetical protein [Holosporales bacterium]